MSGEVIAFLVGIGLCLLIAPFGIGLAIKNQRRRK